MKMSRMLLLGMMLGMLWASPGCIIGTVNVPAPDPRAKDFVQVTKVDGLTVHLADGRKFELAGVDRTSLSRPQLLMAQEYLKSWVTAGDWESSSGILVYPDGERVRLVASIPQLCWQDNKPLIPIKIPVPPNRIDIGSEILIANGLVAAKPDELSDLNMRADYKMLEDKARKLPSAQQFGVWANVDMQLCIAARAGDLDEMKRFLDLGANPTVFYVQDQFGKKTPRLPMTFAMSGYDEGLFHTPLGIQNGLSYFEATAEMWRIRRKEEYRIAMSNRLKAMEFLLKNGADPSLLNQDNYAAEYLAIRARHIWSTPEMIDLLKRYSPGANAKE